MARRIWRKFLEFSLLHSKPLLASLSRTYTLNFYFIGTLPGIVIKLISEEKANFKGCNGPFTLPTDLSGIKDIEKIDLSSLVYQNDVMWMTLKRRLTIFYEKYNPDKVSDINNLIKEYGNKEKDLITKITKKYGPEPKMSEFQKVQGRTIPSGTTFCFFADQSAFSVEFSILWSD